MFKRQTSQFRQENWHPANGFVIKKHHGYEVLSRTDGKSFSSVTLEHKTYKKPLAKDYEFFIPFSGKDVLMYVGHYSVLPIYKELKNEDFSNESEAPKVSESFKLIPRKRTSLVIDGHHYDSSATWPNKTGRGTYVFWGNNKSLTYERLLK